MEEKPRLIFDIGMHMGEDLGFYLQNNAKVVAVDADPLMIEIANRKFHKFITDNKLILVNKAVSDSIDKELNFNLSNTSLWNSLKEEISSRNAGLIQTISVRSTTLPALFEQFGVPYYCKIDIEGMDDVCLQSMMNSRQKPKYLSVETECLAENEIILQDEYLKTLYSLKDLGYSKFQLIDQGTLQPLHLNEKFYYQSNRLFYYANRVLSKLKFRIEPFIFRDYISHQFDYSFPAGSTGPFGEYLNGKWYNFEEAKQLLIEHRSDYFNLKKAVSYGFWCDWHATN